MCVDMPMVITFDTALIILTTTVEWLLVVVVAAVPQNIDGLRLVFRIE